MRRVATCYRTIDGIAFLEQVGGDVQNARDLADATFSYCRESRFFLAAGTAPGRLRVAKHSSSVQSVQRASSALEQSRESRVEHILGGDHLHLGCAIGDCQLQSL